MTAPQPESWAFASYGQPCKIELTTIDFCGKAVPVNAGAAPHFERLAEIFWQEAPNYARRIKTSADTGAYNCRHIGNDSTRDWSKHAWALGIDVRWQENGYGKAPSQCPIWLEARDAVVKAEREGFAWGGRFSTPDCMHFETVLTPHQIATIYGKEWDELASKQEIKEVVREVVKDEINKARKLLAVGEERGYDQEKVNLKALLDK